MLTMMLTLKMDEEAINKEIQGPEVAGKQILSGTLQKGSRLAVNPLCSPGWPLTHGNPSASAY